MREIDRCEIVRRVQGGASFRAIARALGVDRKTVATLTHACCQTRETPSPALPRGRARQSQLDAYAHVIAALLDRYPDIRAVRPHRRNCGRMA
jgi:transposase